MMLHRPIVALVLGVLMSAAIFTPNALAHTDAVTAHQVTAQSARDPKTTPKSTSSNLPLPVLTLTSDTTLSVNTILPEGTVLLNTQILPAGTKFSNGRVLQATLTLQSPVTLDQSITVPAGTRLLGGTGLPVDEIIPGTDSIN
jgi:hypothetical protein